MLRRGILILLLLCLCVGELRSQFYTTGRSSGGTALSQIKTDDYQLIFPTPYKPSALRLSSFLDTIRPYISTGIGVAPRRVPIVLRTSNISSNGYVTWAPRREELVMMPPPSTYALLWSKQLSIHEWRHVTQITALNHGLTKIASWLLGEAGYALGLVVISNWQLEGDATLAETQLAEYGRALQPDFTVGYRALFASGHKKFKRLDPWVCGSYRYEYPDIYKYGYQVMSGVNERLGADNWGEILKYSGRWPIFFFPDAVWLKHNHKTSYAKMARRIFAELDSLWTPHALVEENFEDITRPLKRNYTTYRWPMAVDGGIVALKTDWNRPTRLVSLVDSTEHLIKYVGSVNSMPAVQDSVIYWSEYKPHPIYEQENFSVIRSFDLRTAKDGVYQRWGRHFFVTPMGGSGFAAVSYDQQMKGYIQLFDRQFQKRDTIRFPQTEISLHGLAYDSVGRRLIFIALDDRGMWIGAAKDGRLSQITQPSVVTVSDMRVDRGKVYFSSIESGKNEIHTIDLSSGVEHQLTLSRFGSQAPVALGGDAVVLTTTRADGVMLAQAVVDRDTSRRVEWTRLPQNILNPVRQKWRAPAVDTIVIADSVRTDLPTKRYRRFGHLLNLHSWAPVSFDADYLMEDRPLKIAFGATAFFQSTLSDLIGFATYGYVNESNWVKGHFSYKSLPVEISLAAEYGGGDQLIYGGSPALEMPQVEPYFSGNIALRLPLNLSGLHSLRLLQPSLSVSYNNSRLWSNVRQTFDTGYVGYEASLWWSSSRRVAKRAITPRLGYAIRANVNGAFDARFATLYSIWTRGYLPGIAASHSVTLKAAAQYQRFSDLNFSSKVITPRGFYDPTPTTKYGGASVEYTAPLVYPDWGWEGVIYFKRLWGSVFGDVAGGEYVTQYSNMVEKRYSYSYGVSLGIDFMLFRTFSQAIQLTFAAPRDQKFFFGFNYAMSF